MTQEELEKKIKDAQDAYYNTGHSIMSDVEFDSLWDQLKNEFPDSDLLNEVGEDTGTGFAKVKHDILMGSQNKANTAPEMQKFFDDNSKSETYIAQLKLDGISIALNYRLGQFETAVTRGNGIEGSDVTANVLKMQDVPRSLPVTFTGTVRGEILLHRADKDHAAPDKKNCRNAAAGLVNSLDGKGCEFLHVRCYDAQYKGEGSFKTQLGIQEWLQHCGFQVAPYIVVTKPTGQSAIDYINSIFNDRDEIPYDIDGIVWKTNELDMDDIKNSYRPKTMIALKPKYTIVETTVTDIRWSIKNGTLTPVAQVEPCELCGTTVKQASLANVRCMEDLGIEIGHKVLITKGGEIIPKILKDVTTGISVEGYVF